MEMGPKRLGEEYAHRPGVKLETIPVSFHKKVSILPVRVIIKR